MVITPEEMEEQWSNLLEERPVNLVREDPIDTSALCTFLATKLLRYTLDEKEF
jgi:hypothetical protein